MALSLAFVASVEQPRNMPLKVSRQQRFGEHRRNALTQGRLHVVRPGKPTNGDNSSGSRALDEVRHAGCVCQVAWVAIPQDGVGRTVMVRCATDHNLGAIAKSLAERGPGFGLRSAR